MSKTILIALLVVFLAGGGIAFAQYGPVSELLGLGANAPEIESEEMGPAFGEEVSGLAQEMDPEDFLPEQAQAANNEENENEGERSEVAEAVLNVLGDGTMPEDGDKFGEEVSRQAQEDGRALGEAVSNAAREANSSAGNGN